MLIAEERLTTLHPYNALTSIIRVTNNVRFLSILNLAQVPNFISAHSAANWIYRDKDVTMNYQYESEEILRQ